MSQDAVNAFGRQLGEILEGHLRAALAMGADDRSAAGMVLRRIEMLVNVPLTRRYRAMAMGIYVTRARTMREGGTVQTPRRGMA